MDAAALCGILMPPIKPIYLLAPILPTGLGFQLNALRQVAPYLGSQPTRIRLLMASYSRSRFLGALASVGRSEA